MENRIDIVEIKESAPLSKIYWKDYLSQKYGDIPEFEKDDHGELTDTAKILLEKFSQSKVNKMCDECRSNQIKRDGKITIQCSGLASADSIIPFQMKHLFSSEEMEQFEEIQNPYFWANKYIDPLTDESTKRIFSKRWYQENMVRCTARRKAYRCGRRTGKALALDTKIPTPNGWTTMGELQVGDKVFDEKGKPCNVTFVTEVQHDRDCFEVIFSDGNTIIADRDHQWTVYTKNIRKSNARNKHKQLPPVTLTTGDMLKSIKVGSKQESNYSIPNCGPVKYAKSNATLLVEPYLLGYWLGDGVTNTGRITVGLQDLDIFVNKVESLGYKLRVGGSSPTDHNIYGLSKKLKQIGVRGRKHIPIEYMRASIEDRFELLRGLMDSDGYIDDRGICELTSTIEELANSALELILSLGIKATMKRSESFLYGKRCKDKFRITFNTHMDVFSLPRKRDRLQKKSYAQDNRYIVDIKPTSSVPVKCITVDSPNSLYLASEAFIPTHNTFSFAINILHKVLTNPGYKVLVVTPFDVQAEEIFNQIREFLYKLDPAWGTYDSLVIKDNKSPSHFLQFENRSRIRGFTTGSNGAGSVRGQAADLIVLDEVDYMSEKDLNSIMAILADKPNTEIWMASTPDGRKNLYKQENIPEYRAFHFPTFCLPHYSDSLDKDFKSGLDDIGYIQEIMAEYGASSLGVFQPYFIDKATSSIVDESFREDVLLNRDKYILVLGCDWNDDRVGTRIQIVAFDKLLKRFFVVEKATVSKEGWTQVEAVQTLIDLNRKYDLDHMYLDEGFGTSQIQFMKKFAYDQYGTLPIGHPDLKLADVVGINFSSKIEVRDVITGQETKKDMKTYLVENTVRFLERGAIMLDQMYDKDLMKQMEGYIVKSRSATGRPIYAASEEKVGDHDLDAFMLALLGFAMEYSELLKMDTSNVIMNLVSKGDMQGNPDPLKDYPDYIDEFQVKKDISFGERRAADLYNKKFNGYNRASFKDNLAPNGHSRHRRANEEGMIFEGRSSMLNHRAFSRARF